MGRAPNSGAFADCEICGKAVGFRWTDTHGVGACHLCGAPYKILYYEGEGDDLKRIDKPPQILFLPEWIPLMKKYWEENKRNCDPGAYNIPGSSYEVATQEDVRVYGEWMEAHKDEHPKPVEVAP